MTSILSLSRPKIVRGNPLTTLAYPKIPSPRNPECETETGREREKDERGEKDENNQKIVDRGVARRAASIDD
jgi:hypothetical protein